MTSQTTQKKGGSAGLLDELPVDRLKEEALELGKALARRGASRIGERLSDATDKVGGLGDMAPSPGDVVKAASKVGSPLSPVKEAASKVKDALPGTGSDDAGSGRKGGGSTADETDLKVTNIVETIDVPVGRDLAYKLWTQFEEFPTFMKKVENVTQKNPAVVTWKAQVLWSHRTWTARIIDQTPPEHIVWKSEADKGHVDGAVTFHELAPDLTRVLVSLEYYPQGLFERTGNLWRAQGRRVRLELKHFRRFVANHALLHQDDVDGWLGEIREGKVKRQRASTSSKSRSGGSSARKSTSGGGSATKKSSSSSSGCSTAKKAGSGNSSARKSTSGGGSAAKKSSSSSSGGSTAKKSASSGSTTRTRAAKKPASKRTAAATAKRSSTARASTTKRTAPASSRPTKASSSRSKSSGSKARKSSSGRSSGSRSKS